MTPTDPKFDNQMKSFYNTSDIVQMLPNRAVLNTPKMFMAVLTEDILNSYEFPKNIFMLKNSSGGLIIPPFIVSSADYDSKEVSSSALKIKITDEKDSSFSNKKKRTLQTETSTASAGGESPVPSEEDKKKALFEDGRQFFLIPYFPYFGNCTYYGSQLFVYPTVENNPACRLVPRGAVQPIANMRFGMQPVADSCTNIVAQCS